MFSLKFDLLFPTIDAAKDLARNLNAKRKPHPLSRDPREIQRIRAELQAARDRLSLHTILHRNRIL
mgnify:CR=1 FL=1